MTGIASRLAVALLVGRRLLAALASAAARRARPPVRIEALPLLGAQSPMGEGWASVGVRLDERREHRDHGRGRAPRRALVEQRRAAAAHLGAVRARARRRASRSSCRRTASPARPPELELVVVDRAGTEIAKVPRARVPHERSVAPRPVVAEPHRARGARRSAWSRSAASAAATGRRPRSSPRRSSIRPPAIPSCRAGRPSTAARRSSSRPGASSERSRKPELRRARRLGARRRRARRRRRPPRGSARSSSCTTLAGGHVERTSAPSELCRPALFLVAADKRQRGPSLDACAAQRLAAHGRAARAPRTERRHRGLLDGFTGGNLRASPWGAVASYGLGEVHLLAFDATEEQLSAIAGRSSSSSISCATPGSARPRSSAARADGVRRLPHERDPRRARSEPLDALDDRRRGARSCSSTRRSPDRSTSGSPRAAASRCARSLTCRSGRRSRSALVVALGVARQGRQRPRAPAHADRSRRRHGARRRHALSRALRLVVARHHRACRPSRSSLLDVSSGDDYVERTLVVDRDGARLERLRTKPWATVVVREDGFASLAGGISIVTDANGEVVVKNRAARDLLGVVLEGARPSGGGFRRITRRRVRAREGRRRKSALSSTLPRTRSLRRRSSSGGRAARARSSIATSRASAPPGKRSKKPPRTSTSGWRTCRC